MLEWVTLFVGIITSCVVGGSVLYKYSRERRDREDADRRLAAVHVNPFLQAAEALQSRLYNILELWIVSLKKALPQ